MDYYKIIISPESIKNDLSNVPYSGGSVGVYSGMTQVLTGGVNGSSLLTGLTIPILITENINDVGYYDPFDGAISQKDVVTNFIFSSETTSPYKVFIYNTTDELNKFQELSTYLVDWGDGTSKERLTGFTPNYLSHQYPTEIKEYTITLEQTNPWGLIKIEKSISLPFTNVSILNPKGTSYFTPSGGSWAGTPVQYDYLFSGDSENKVEKQVSSANIITPFVVSGTTYSRLQDFEQYGSTKYPQPGVPVIKNRQMFGVINTITSIYTGYTIQDIDYYDYIDGTTVFFVKSSGFTSENITAEPISKREVLIGVIDQPQIQSNVYIERGKNSAYERIQRLGEVDNVGDLVNYGYGFFNVEKKI